MHEKTESDYYVLDLFFELTGLSSNFQKKLKNGTIHPHASY